MDKLTLKYNELCSGNFEFCVSEQKEFLKSLNLKTYDGYRIILNDCFTRYNQKADIYFIRAFYLEDSNYQEKHRVWVKRRGQYECILLIEDNLVYLYFDRNMGQEGTSVELKEVISDSFSNTDELWLRRIIAKCAYHEFAIGWEYYYSDERALFHLNACK
ncbi:MAG: hypothetical protein K2I93_02145 [Oscillospiraceae bacterium]|nr:hypothetical protein [Oscillospiraceae bacterium]